MRERLQRAEEAQRAERKQDVERFVVLEVAAIYGIPESDWWTRPRRPLTVRACAASTSTWAATSRRTSTMTPRRAAGPAGPSAAASTPAAA